MTAPVATGPYFRRGTTKFRFAPTIANLKAPTRAEITAGVAMRNITGVSGFAITRSFIGTPTLDSDFTSNIPGERSAGESSLTFRDDRDAATAAIRTALPEGTTGYMIYMPEGDVPGRRCEVWPVTSGGVNDQVSLDGFASFQISFATPNPPEQAAVIP